MLKKSLWMLIYSNSKAEEAASHTGTLCAENALGAVGKCRKIAFTACSVLSSFLYMNPRKTGSINKVINWERLVVIPLSPRVIQILKCSK